jgi:hypothetical protein
VPQHRPIWPVCRSAEATLIQVQAAELPYVLALKDILSRIGDHSLI